jgi:hypothetical protein
MGLIYEVFYQEGATKLSELTLFGINSTARQ